MGRRRLIAGSAAALAAITVLAVPALQAQGAGSALQVGVPTVVDPIRSGAEPYIVVDNANQPWVGAPGGTSVQTSWFWQSRDHGLTYQLMGPSDGHWLCGNTGGGDSSLSYDKTSNVLYLMDQQALASIASGRFDLTHQQLTARKCFSTPAMTADRPFQAVLHPTGSQQPLQIKDDGGKPMVYLSWLCDGCTGGGSTEGGLAFAWSTDGVNWHAADPGVPLDNLATNQFFEASAIQSFSFHGTMAVDQATGYVYTGITCSDTSCPNGLDRNEVGIAIGKPGATRADLTNPGQFASVTYQTAAHTISGQTMRKQGSLFPVIAEDKAGTLYEMWVDGDGLGDDADAAPDPQEWHLYYTYSKDRPDHKVWSAPQQVDLPSMSKTNDFGWMTAGDAGKLGFLWLGANVREQPSHQNPAKTWHAYMSVVTNADTAHPSFHEARVGRAPMHYGDMCLQGTICGASAGNRNMADFISLDIGPDGALTATYAGDANRLAPKATDLNPGLAVTQTVHQTSGPKLIGNGNVNDSRFSTTPVSHSPLDSIGDGRYPVPAGTNRSQLDLRDIHFARTSNGLDVTLDAANLSNTTSPSLTQPNAWYLVTWSDPAGRLWFARAESDRGGALTFHAGEPTSYDRPGIGLGTFPTLVDYQGGTTVTGTKNGNAITIHVPASVVGSPKSSDVLESVTGWTVLDNGLPLFDTTPVGNVPTVVDATPAYDVGIHGLPAAPAPVAPPHPSGGGNLATTGGPGAAFGAIALLLTVGGFVLVRRRRRAA